MQSNKIKLIVIVGVTGSGKTDLAIKLAKKYNCEIISADSRSVFRFLDIGTAKPTRQELGDVSIWGIDLVNPNKKFTVYDFQQYANKKITEIQSRNKIPIIVGGSGLYIDSVMLNYQFVKLNTDKLSVNFNKMTIAQLHDYCIENNIEIPENYKNKRYIINSILSSKQSSRKEEPGEGVLVVGIKVDKVLLKKNLELRTYNMLQSGVISEYKKFISKFGSENELIKGNIYNVLKKTSPNFNEEEIVRLTVQSDLKLAKKQMTWFKRHKFIKWLDRESSYKFIAGQIEKYFYS